VIFSLDAAGKGRALAAAGRLDEALAVLRAASEASPDAVDVHLAIYEAAQLARREPLALDHQRRAIALAPVQTTAARVREDYALLVPSMPGLWVANTPVELLVDADRVTVHRWYVDPGGSVPALPAYDAIFTAIGESRAAQPYLAATERFIAAQGAAAINRPAEIARLGRTALARTFAAARRCRVPAAAALGREEYAGADVEMPHIVRPRDTHGGNGLVKIETPADKEAFLAGHPAGDVYVAPFIDYRSADGYFRKYRIVFVGGEPYPFHLAISPNWMVHYYNAPMAEQRWMRDEEHAFLARLETVFGGELGEALREAAALLPLDYVGIDCAIDREGKLLIFEADTAIIVHLLDDPALFGYKYAYVPRITAALDALLRRAVRR
jgi:glutathione synthase/RimK-type ligase-like ATP-grasp enzyme